MLHVGQLTVLSYDSACLEPNEFLLLSALSIIVKRTCRYIVGLYLYFVTTAVGLLIIDLNSVQTNVHGTFHMNEAFACFQTIGTCSLYCMPVSKELIHNYNIHNVYYYYNNYII